MPMVCYTEEELIEAGDLAVKDAMRDVERHRAQYMAENTALRRQLNDAKDAIHRIVHSPTIKNLCGWYPEIKAAADLLDPTPTSPVETPNG